MESKEYRLEEYTGEIYTRQQFVDFYLPVLPDHGVIGHWWDRMTIVPTEGLNIEEVRRKLRGIYAKPYYVEGDIIKKDITSRQSWTVRYVDGRLMACPNTNVFFTNIEPVEIEGEYIKLTSMRGIDFSRTGGSFPTINQHTYHMAMNHLKGK